MVIFRTDQDRDSRLVETSSLAVPFLDTVQRNLSRQVEHEEYSDSIVADQGQHVDKLSLAAQIPDAEGDLGVPYADGLLHEIDTQSLNIVFIPATLDVFYHQRCLADLCIPYHSDLDDDMVAPITLFCGAVALSRYMITKTRLFVTTTANANAANAAAAAG